MNKEGSVYVKCDLCGYDEPVLFLEKDGFNIVKCKNCSMVYVNPRLPNEKQCDLYNQNVISPFQYYLDTKLEDEKTFEERLDFIESYANMGSILDVGCSIGTFSNVAKRRGWKVFGIDINKSSVNYCREKFNLDVKTGNFEEVDQPKNSFDVILMNDFLEHVASPTKALKKAYKLLKNRGLIYIVTPKIDSTLAKFSKSRWLHLKPDEHLYYFSTKTISKLLIKSGFEVMSIKSIGRYRNLNTIFLKANTYGNFIYKFFRIFVDNRFGKNIILMLNLRDEMAVLARKV